MRALPALQLIASLAGLYLSALGFTLLWMWQCAWQGADPWLINRSAQ